MGSWSSTQKRVSTGPLWMRAVMKGKGVSRGNPAKERNIQRGKINHLFHLNYGAAVR